MPEGSEFSCRLRDPDDFDRIRSTDGTIDGKKIRNLIGLDGDSSSRQSIRFPKSSWSRDEARSECSKRNGDFEK